MMTLQTASADSQNFKTSVLKAALLIRSSTLTSSVISSSPSCSLWARQSRHHQQPWWKYCCRKHSACELRTFGNDLCLQGQSVFLRNVLSPRAEGRCLGGSSFCPFALVCHKCLFEHPFFYVRLLEDFFFNSEVPSHETAQTDLSKNVTC